MSINLSQYFIKYVVFQTYYHNIELKQHKLNTSSTFAPKRKITTQIARAPCVNIGTFFETLFSLILPASIINQIQWPLEIMNPNR